MLYIKTNRMALHGQNADSIFFRFIRIGFDFGECADARVHSCRSNPNVQLESTDTVFYGLRRLVYAVTLGVLLYCVALFRHRACRGSG